MIQSLFILTSAGQVLIERHFRGIVTERDVCNYWMMYASGFLQPDTNASTLGCSTTILPPPTPASSGTLSTSASSMLHDNHNNTNHCVPIMEIPSDKQGTLYVISIRRDNLNYLAICPNEINPLMVLEFLNRLVVTLQEYFYMGRVDEVAIKDNFITIYQLLEEMIDFGWPLTTEINALKVLIRPPTILSKLLSTATGQSSLSSSAMPSIGGSTSDPNQQQHSGATLANMPWRAAGVYYSNNEIYVDIIEEVDAIVDQRSGKIVTADVQGSIVCQSHLSGVPDLLLTFNDPNIIDDCSFHPCVRYEKFERDQVVSFVPPDGNFELMRYRIDKSKVRNVVPPIYCQAQWSSSDHTNSTSDTNGAGVNNVTNTIVESNSAAATTQNGRLSIQVGVATLSSLIFSSSVRANGGKTTIEDIVVQIPFPRGTNVVSDFRVNMGTVVYDEVFKVAKWSVISSLDTTTTGGTTSVTLPATFACKFTISTSSSTATKTVAADVASPYPYLGMSSRRQKICERYQRKQQKQRRQQKHNTNWLVSPPNVGISWKIPLASVSGIAVSGLSVMGETYRPYKGVRNITQAGIYQVRCT
jgi:AP-3 complex subunit mu